MAKYQLQIRVQAGGRDSWQDIVSGKSCHNVAGPASREEAFSYCQSLSTTYPDKVYRVVKLVKEK
jgi:hypothetical protein